MLSMQAYKKAHKEFPFAESYPQKQDSCSHNFCFVVYCDGKTDIVRCTKCGKEKEVRCNFDDEYD